MGDVVAGVGVAWILRERALGEPPRLRVAAHLVIGEGEGGLEPPVLAVGGCQPLEESAAELLAIRPPREADRAARLVDEQGVARELRHVLVDQGEATRGLAGDSVDNASTCCRSRRWRPAASSRARPMADRAAAPSPRKSAMSAAPAWGMAKSSSAAMAAAKPSSAPGAVSELPVHPS